MLSINSLVAFLMSIALTVSLTAEPPQSFLPAAIQAHGGGQALSNVFTVRMHGTASLGGAVQTLTISASIPDQSMRLDYGAPASRTRVLRPGKGWERSDTKVTLNSPHSNAYSELDRLGILGLGPMTLPSAYETDRGPQTLNGRDVRGVDLDAGKQQTHYRKTIDDRAAIRLDAQTGLILSVARKGYADRSLDLEFTLEHRFSDYRQVSGLILPFRIETLLNGKLKETIALERIEINPALDAGLFEP